MNFIRRYFIKRKALRILRHAKVHVFANYRGHATTMALWILNSAIADVRYNSER